MITKHWNYDHVFKPSGDELSLDTVQSTNQYHSKHVINHCVLSIISEQDHTQMWCLTAAGPSGVVLFWRCQRQRRQVWRGGRKERGHKSGTVDILLFIYVNIKHPINTHTFYSCYFVCWRKPSEESLRTSVIIMLLYCTEVLLITLNSGLISLWRFSVNFDL